MTTQNSFTNDFNEEDFIPGGYTTSYPEPLPVSMTVAAAAALINPVLALPVLGWWAAKQFTK